MRPGTDRIIGELWRFEAEQMPTLLETLDQIEGTGQPGQADLYHRVVTEVFSSEGTSLGDAYTYHYATDPTSDGFTRMRAADGVAFVCWPR